MTISTTLAPAPVQSPPASPGPCLEVVISHQDIVEGVQSDGRACAAAVALRRAGYRDVCVLGAGGVWANGLNYTMTHELQSWIGNFDWNKTRVAPERFLLEPSGITARDIAP